MPSLAPRPTWRQPTPCRRPSRSCSQTSTAENCLRCGAEFLMPRANSACGKVRGAALGQEGNPPETTRPLPLLSRVPERSSRQGYAPENLSLWGKGRNPSRNPLCLKRCSTPVGRPKAWPHLQNKPRKETWRRISSLTPPGSSHEKILVSLREWIVVMVSPVDFWKVTANYRNMVKDPPPHPRRDYLNDLWWENVNQDSEESHLLEPPLLHASMSVLPFVKDTSAPGRQSVLMSGIAGSVSTSLAFGVANANLQRDHLWLDALASEATVWSYCGWKRIFSTQQLAAARSGRSKSLRDSTSAMRSITLRSTIHLNRKACNVPASIRRERIPFYIMLPLSDPRASW